jgi:acyl carrier protein
MADLQTWVDIIYAAIDARNELAPDQPPVAKSLETTLIGSDEIDSLEFISIIIFIEEKVQDLTGLAIAIANEDATEEPDEAFRTVETTAQFVAQQVAAATNG